MQLPEDDVRIEDREDAPFLAEQASDHRPDGATTREKLRIRLMITLFAIIFFIETGGAMTVGPITRIFEAIACRQYYEIHDASAIGSNGQIPEEMCKGNIIQGEVAIVKGYGELFDGLTSILLAAPYGLLADRYGRKPMICMSIPGFIINIVSTGIIMWYSDIFPLRAVWLSSLSWLFGGGLVVTAAIVWTMMADVTTDSQRAPMFFRFGVAVMGSEFISSAVSSWLMTLDPWIPLLLGWGIIIVGILLVLTLPETIQAFPSQQTTTSYELSSLSAEIHEGDGSTPLPPHEKETLVGALRRRMKSLLSTYAFVASRKPLVLLLSAFLVYRLSRGTSWFLVQYVSVRYGWTIAQANLLISLKSILMVILFLFILPFLSWYLIHRRGTDNNEKDLILTKFSIISLMIGTLGMGLSPRVSILISFLVIQTLGAGFVYTARSLTTSMVQRSRTARLYTMIEIIQAFGTVIASAAMTTVFNWGLNLGGFWIGIAWMFASGLFAIIAAVIWAVKPPPIVKEAEDSDRI